MRTVESLIKELEKFPKDATCFAYEGEEIGVAIETLDRKYGFIHAPLLGEIKETEVIK